jgi:hypothetical protein
MTKNIKMNRYASDSSTIYAEAIIEACKKLKLDPLEAITNTEDHPKLLKTANIEFAIGWLNGCAESHGVTIEKLWEKIAPKAAKNVARYARAA